MIRLILFILAVLFVIAGVLAVVLYHFFGWTGLIVFPFIVIALLWVAKIIIRSLIKQFALGLFGMKAGVLKGATMNVHSVKAVPRPPESRPEPDEDDPDESEEETKGNEEDDEPAEPEPPQDYFEVDMTITPKNGSNDRVWEPSELILMSEKVTSLADLEEKETGTTHSVEIWDGTVFGPDDPGKYPGEQRLKIIFAVKPGIKSNWLHYYNQPIGQLKLVGGTIDV